jgi:hypothetical protein
MATKQVPWTVRPMPTTCSYAASRPVCCSPCARTSSSLGAGGEASSGSVFVAAFRHGAESTATFSRVFGAARRLGKISTRSYFHE